MVYVGISRVRNANDIRIFRLLPSRRSKLENAEFSTPLVTWYRVSHPLPFHSASVAKKNVPSGKKTKAHATRTEAGNKTPLKALTRTTESHKAPHHTTKRNLAPAAHETSRAVSKHRNSK
jgi:hypothetical protein